MIPLSSFSCDTIKAFVKYPVANGHCHCNYSHFHFFPNSKPNPIWPNNFCQFLMWTTQKTTFFISWWWINILDSMKARQKTKRSQKERQTIRKTNATNVTMHPLMQAIWRGILKHTGEKSHTNATSVAMHPFVQANWWHTWKGMFKIDGVIDLNCTNLATLKTLN